MILTDEEGYAIPGSWERRYLRAWTKAFPHSFEKPGHFQGNVWVSANPAWDAWWFDLFGVKPPKRRTFRDYAMRNGDGLGYD